MPEQEIAQRPGGNGQDRTEQDGGGERSQHRKDADNQTCEQQEQNGALEELSDAARPGDLRRVPQGREFILPLPLITSRCVRRSA